LPGALGANDGSAAEAGIQTAAVQGSYSLICSLPPMATVAGSSAPSTIVMYNVVEE
jgi:hypothetical protein